jgi:hypothetical protein
MSQNTIENPLDRLQLLPDAMNWKGAWNNNDQYFRNDVVISSLNNSSYILVGRTALVGGGDPSLNADWLELNVSTTGVTSINGSAYIGITGPGTNPTIVNNGVRTVSAGVGISLAGTANDPIVRNNGIVALLPGPGINIATPIAPPFIATIDNTGVRQINVNPAGLSQTDTTGIVGLSNTGVLSVTSAPGSGISVSAGQNPSITNTGVLSVTAAGPPATSGITVTPGQNPQISASGCVFTITSTPTSGIQVGGTVNNKTLLNTGVRTLAVNPAGLSQTDTSGNISIANTGVLSVTAADTSVIVTPGQNPTIRSAIPKISALGQSITLSACSPNPLPFKNLPADPPTVAQTPLIGYGPTIFSQYLANGTPASEPNGGFLLNFSGTQILCTAVAPWVLITTYIYLRLADTTTPGGPYYYDNYAFGGSGAQTGIANTTPPFVVSLGNLYVPIAAARAAGVRQVDFIELVNDSAYQLEFFSGNQIFAQYYPLGLQ